MKPNTKVSARFFTKTNRRTDFHGGWDLHSYKVANGEFTKVWEGASTSRVYFNFTIPTMGSRSKRHLSELRLSKPGGDCSKVLSEAF